MTADPHQAAEQAALLAALQPVAAAINGKPEETPCSSLPCAGLERVCTAFGLSRFERSVLLLCAGVELDSRFADACAAAHGDPGRGYATFGLALATLPGAHWSALTPARPLRAWRLLEMQGADTLATSRLRIGERILHSLVGVESNEPAFDGVIVRIAPEQAELQAAEFGGIGLDTLLRNGRRLTFTGRNARQRRAAACLALMQADLSPWVLRASDIPSQAAERAQLRLLWNREIRLVPSGLCLEISSADPPEVYRHTAAFLAGLEGAVVVTMTEEVFLDDDSAAARIELPALDASKRRDAWRDGLGEAASRLNGGLDAVIEQFAPGAESLALVSSTLAAMPDAPASALSRAAWTICREQARRPMAQLARRIAPRATWEDLVLPEGQSQMLRQIAAHLRHRRTVHETWGFADSSARGLGLTGAVLRRQRDRQDHGSRGAGGASSISICSISTSPPRCQQIHRRDREEPPAPVRRRRRGRRDPAVRRGRRAVWQAQRGQGQPRPLRQHRGQLSAAADGGVPGSCHPDHQRAAARSTRRSCGASASSSISRFPTRPSASGSGAASSRPATPTDGLDFAQLAQSQRDRRHDPQHRHTRGVPRGRCRRPGSDGRCDVPRRAGRVCQARQAPDAGRNGRLAMNGPNRRARHRLALQRQPGRDLVSAAEPAQAGLTRPEAARAHRHVVPARYRRRRDRLCRGRAQRAHNRPVGPPEVQHFRSRNNRAHHRRRGAHPDKDPPCLTFRHAYSRPA